MEAKDLRIGNAVHYKHTGVNNVVKKYLCKLDGEDIEAMAERVGYLKLHEPIKLTDNWLERFGFEKCNGVWRIKLGEDLYLRGHIANNAFNCCIDGSTCDIESRVSIKICKYKYVHQLQNLYFALTGEELKLKSE